MSNETQTPKPVSDETKLLTTGPGAAEQPAETPAAKPKRPNWKVRGEPRLVDKSVEELRAIGTKRAIQAIKKKAEALVYSSTVPVTKAEALELLEGRNVKHPHIKKIVCAELFKFAEENHIPANKFLFSNGALQTIRSYAAQEGLPLDEAYRSDDDVPAELLGMGELYSLFDAFYGPHYQDTSYDDYRNLRFTCKNDVYELGHLLGFDGFSDCHRAWAHAFFPQWDATDLPRNYTMKQRNEWTVSQSPIKDRLLLASRRAFKSTAGRVLVAGLLVTCWDSTVVYISETKSLAKQNIEGLRGFFEVEPGVDSPYVRFQRTFPEATIPKGDGSALTYEHPCARLRLGYANVQNGSMDAATAGKRAMLILGDDVISEETSGNEEIRDKQARKWSLVKKLREKGAYSLLLATPYNEDDLYAREIAARASDKHKDPTFLVRIDPAFLLKPYARKKLTSALVPTITFDDIESFLMPADLMWAELQVDMRTSPSTFLSQNLCVFPRDIEDGIQIQFTHEAIWKRVKTLTELGRPSVMAKNFIAVDRSGGSIARTADFQCAVVGRVQAVDHQNAVCVIDAKMVRERDSAFIIETLIPLIKEHHPQVIIFEKDKGWADFEQTLRMELLKRAIPVPWIRTTPIDNSPRAKARLAKRMETPLATGRLYFNAAIEDLEACLLQLEKFDGTSSNTFRKDDFVDSLRLLCEALLPSTFVEVETDDEAKKRHAEREQILKDEEAKRQRQEYHDRMFSTGIGIVSGQGSEPDRSNVSTARQWGNKPTEPAPEPEPAPAAPRQFPRGSGFAILPSGLRGRPRE